MPNIRPVSDLRNYAEVLKEISFDEPVFLTKNGRGCYAIVDIEEYEKTRAIIKLMGKLSEAEKSAQENGWILSEDVSDILGVK
ncbi:MAG: type II toxin-antitoxin system prevent-host-death family antitoxin [Ruminococcaceae bacterium]|nr:type II toxin-antitoxin system prevent-host-death family antitoxin [Oscillospiraceae bacterium]